MSRSSKNSSKSVKDDKGGRVLGNSMKGCNNNAIIGILDRRFEERKRLKKYKRFKADKIDTLIKKIDIRRYQTLGYMVINFTQ